MRKSGSSVKIQNKAILNSLKLFNACIAIENSLSLSLVLNRVGKVDLAEALRPPFVAALENIAPHLPE